ncbi:MAG: class I tRNA ligase family protein, partial [Alphaproteobacteria bacterium]|nr:class I tRNA ligase family protein [Alphaproteobacteria bacterium]
MLSKTYEPREVEARLYEMWESSGAFFAGKKCSSVSSPFCCILPPPNVTGFLHMGHALNVTIQDIVCRFERMRGKDVLWQPGSDHAGIATQMVVERQLSENGEAERREIGRTAFLERVWQWKAQYGETILSQLKRLGASSDWSRIRFTMDEDMSHSVVNAFVTLYRDGLIYKDKRLVNWDPRLLTAISDLEVEQKEVKGHLWYFRYPVEGEPDHFVTIATTRPETLLGDTAISVHPEDERYKALIGKHVILPLIGRRLPVVADSYSDPEKG